MGIGFIKSRLDGSFSGDINATGIQFSKPSLICAGRQDTEFGYVDQNNLCSGFQRATILILDKAGHNLLIERQRIFQAAFLNWIERIATIDLHTNKAIIQYHAEEYDCA
jgi:pimeloyl-ACP methyl ester carboxylesterase